MSTVEQIKNEIKRLYENNPIIHISVKMTRPRVIVKNTPVRLVGVYKNIFQVEEADNGCPKRHTLQYGDVLIGQVEIAELGYAPTVRTKK